MKVSKEIVIYAILPRIRSRFGNDPLSKLCYAIIEQAVLDLIAKYHIDRDSAKQYLNNPFHADLCGVERQWITKTLKKVELL